MIVKHLRFVVNTLQTLLIEERRRFDNAIEMKLDFDEVKTRGREIRMLEKQISWYSDKIDAMETYEKTKENGSPLKP